MKTTKMAIVGIAILKLLVIQALGQDIYSSGPLFIPQSPATTYEVTSGQTVHIFGGNQVVLGPGTSLDAGSNVTILASPGGVVPLAPNQPSTDGTMNWRITSNYDGSGNQLLSTKEFFGILGNNLQTQTMTSYRYPDGTHGTQ